MSITPFMVKDSSEARHFMSRPDGAAVVRGRVSFKRARFLGLGLPGRITLVRKDLPHAVETYANNKTLRFSHVLHLSHSAGTHGARTVRCSFRPEFVALTRELALTYYHVSVSYIINEPIPWSWDRHLAGRQE